MLPRRVFEGKDEDQDSDITLSDVEDAELDCNAVVGGRAATPPAPVVRDTGLLALHPQQTHSRGGSYPTYSASVPNCAPPPPPLQEAVPAPTSTPSRLASKQVSLVATMSSSTDSLGQPPPSPSSTTSSSASCQGIGQKGSLPSDDSVRCHSDSDEDVPQWQKKRKVQDTIVHDVEVPDVVVEVKGETEVERLRALVKSLSAELTHTRADFDKVEKSVFDLSSEKSLLLKQKDDSAALIASLQAGAVSLHKEQDSKDSVVVALVSDQVALCAERDAAVRRAVVLEERVKQLEVEVIQVRATVEESNMMVDSLLHSKRKKKKEKAKGDKEKRSVAAAAAAPPPIAAAAAAAAVTPPAAIPHDETAVTPKGNG